MTLTRDRLATYCLWGTISGLVFLSVYPTMNWLTAQRPWCVRAYASWELGIPFVPELIWAYLSMYVMFLMPPLFLDPPHLRVLGKQLVMGTVLSAIIYLLLPATLGYERVLPANPTLHGIYAGMFRLDCYTHNLVPSLHVVWSSIIAWAIGDPASRGWRWLFGGWLLLICVSTVLVHQHHLIDVASALGLVTLLRRGFKRLPEGWQ